MSGVHFAVSVAAGSLRLQNLSGTVGTDVNGQSAESRILQSGDLIKAGQTVFGVIAPAASPYTAQVHIGGWGFDVIPEGWHQMGDLGFRLFEAASFKANITAVEEPLQPGQTLSSYVETQMMLARGQVTGISVNGPIPAIMRGADEAFELEITIVRDDTRFIQRQIYAVHSGIVGIFTATVSEAEPHLDSVNAVIAGLSYFQG